MPLHPLEFTLTTAKKGEMPKHCNTINGGKTLQKGVMPSGDYDEDLDRDRLQRPSNSYDVVSVQLCPDFTSNLYNYPITYCTL